MTHSSAMLEDEEEDILDYGCRCNIFSHHHQIGSSYAPSSIIIFDISIIIYFYTKSGKDVSVVVDLISIT